METGRGKGVGWGRICVNYYQKQDHVKLTPQDTTSTGYLKRNVKVGSVQRNELLPACRTLSVLIIS